MDDKYYCCNKPYMGYYKKYLWSIAIVGSYTQKNHKASILVTEKGSLPKKPQKTTNPTTITANYKREYWTSLCSQLKKHLNLYQQKDRVLESFGAPSPNTACPAPDSFPEKATSCTPVSTRSPTVLLCSSYSLMAKSKLFIWLPEKRKERLWETDREGETEKAKAE